jgi:hypothetical protein
VLVRVWMLMIQLETTMTMDERVRHKSAIYFVLLMISKYACVHFLLLLMNLIAKFVGCRSRN